MLALTLTLMGLVAGAAPAYVGKSLGRLAPLDHDVSGEVFAVDSRTLHIRGFSYDGTAPDAFFYGGRSGKPSDDGFIIPDEKGSKKPLGRYRNQDVTITLPKGVSVKDLRWLSIWCRAFTINFGHLMIPRGVQYPRPQKIGALKTLDHNVKSGPIVVVDAQTFLIPSFSYDGTAPDAYFWVGTGTPNSRGTLVPNENGDTQPLKRYDAKTLVITLPGDLTVFDVDYLSVWCDAFSVDFGHVKVPSLNPDALNVPPSLRMLGVAPQSKLNCEVLHDPLAMEVRWAVAGRSIVMQLVGRVADGEYMSFGLSGAQLSSVMVGGDVVTAWLERATGRGYAVDYHLGAKAQCSGGQGSCPDHLAQGSNDVRLLNAAFINDFSMLTFQRPLAASDARDRAIATNGSQAVIWAVGPVNAQGGTSYHSVRSRGNLMFDFGRSPQWNCPLPDDGSPSTPPPPAAGSPRFSQPATAPASQGGWTIPPIPCHEPEDGVFDVTIGPTGGEQGYKAITGQVGWGIALYVNGLLIPEIHVVRGRQYTFLVNTGHNPANPAKTHPLYITDDPEGGYADKTPRQRQSVRVFAGVEVSAGGEPTATATGRLCEYKRDPASFGSSSASFAQYQRNLDLQCEPGQPGVLTWVPDAATPDLVYYQCYTHRNLGWKIHVHDSCDSLPRQGSFGR